MHALKHVQSLHVKTFRQGLYKWKIQCKLALIKEGLWGIVNGTERAPTENADQHARFAARRDKVLATIVLAITKSALCNWR